MITRESIQRRKVPIRTIISAIAMLIGIIVMGFGYFQNKQPVIYVGMAITLSGVLTEAMFGIIGNAGKSG